MNVALPKPWTQEQFFAWAERQEERFEFDGTQPVAMTGGNVGHAMIMSNLHFSLNLRLRNGPCRSLGPDAGVQTIGTAVRYPDALITCSKLDRDSRLIPDAVAVFEILSPTSSRTDRIVKLREYAAVPTILSYVILESTSAALTVMKREMADEIWRVTTLTGNETLLLPKPGIEIPVADFYDQLDFGDENATA